MSCCKQLGNGFEAVEISLGGESVCEIGWQKFTLLLERTQLYTDRPLTGLICIMPLVSVCVWVLSRRTYRHDEWMAH